MFVFLCLACHTFLKLMDSLDSIIINLFSQLASFVWRVQNLIVEDWEVEGQTQTDGMCWLHFTLANVKCILVSGLRVIDNGCGL